jgi:hypothetical protein
MNPGNEEILAPNPGVRFRHAQMILELLMHTPDGDLYPNPDSRSNIGA